MLGHWLTPLACLFSGHRPIFEWDDARQPRWRCERCVRVTESAALRRAQ